MFYLTNKYKKKYIYSYKVTNWGTPSVLYLYLRLKVVCTLDVFTESIGTHLSWVSIRPNAHIYKSTNASVSICISEQTADCTCVFLVFFQNLPQLLTHMGLTLLNTTVLFPQKQPSSAESLSGLNLSVNLSHDYILFIQYFCGPIL